MSVLVQFEDESMDDTPAESTLPLTLQNKDSLRLLGLSRIPRCADCPRLHALQAAHRSRTCMVFPWPAQPGNCRHQVCAPLVRRFGAGATAIDVFPDAG